MLEALDDLAQEGSRSRNAEIVMRLEYAVDVAHEAILDHRQRKANEGAPGGHA